MTFTSRMNNLTVILLLLNSLVLYFTLKSNLKLKYIYRLKKPKIQLPLKILITITYKQTQTTKVI